MEVVAKGSWKRGLVVHNCFVLRMELWQPGPCVLNMDLNTWGHQKILDIRSEDLMPGIC